MKQTLLGIIAFCISSITVTAQKEAYFIDGFHGGGWGHYPKGYTAYIVDQLQKHPEWNINLELEPETWIREKRVAAAAYEDFRALYENTESNSRIEYVNPSFAQSYLFTASGESAIRQFYYGIKLLRGFFPNAVFKSYSSEEPCFTSALPQILTSFGFEYASLKNPNTCWGGYTRAHGGELVYWTGSDGSQILTVPRYEFEKLKPGSTWETIANGNSPEYVEAAFNYGVKYPVGMCLQDAGWRWGPWLKGKEYKPSIYTTWSNYFKNIVAKDTADIPNWNFNQEDLQVSLVWGAQVLQRLAQQVRTAENNILQAEKVAVMDNLEYGTAYPATNIDKAWRQLMLSEHHDCWIVPYNGRGTDTWANRVKDWTAYVNKVSDTIIAKAKSQGNWVKVYNTSGYARTDYVKIFTNDHFLKNPALISADNGVFPLIPIEEDGQKYYIGKVTVPAFGYSVFNISQSTKAVNSNISFKTKNNIVAIETSQYKVTLDAEEGGAITSLIAKGIDNKEFVDKKATQKFGGLQGNFYNNGGQQNSFGSQSKISVKSQGKDFIEVETVLVFAGNEVVKTMKLYNDNPRIDFKLRIDWKENIGIGTYDQNNYKGEDLKKAFYNDKNKLLTVFPLNLKRQQVYKNAPFDVMKSNLDNTFFDRWDEIKNTVILNWVDVTDSDDKYGCALFTDHTTSYTHGKDFPLGLTVQYSGKGLWGRDYTIEGPTEINYSILPHKGNWKDAGIWMKNKESETPLRVEILSESPEIKEKSFLNIDKKGWELVSVEMRESDIYIRIFNAEANTGSGTLSLGFNPAKVELVKLDGTVESAVSFTKQSEMYSAVLNIPQFGFKTIKISPNK